MADARCAHCALPPSGTAEARYCRVGCRLAAAAAGRGGPAGLLQARLLLAAFLTMGVITFSRVRALAAFRARLRPGAREAVAELGALGPEVEVLSGDHTSAPRASASPAAPSSSPLASPPSPARSSSARRATDTPGPAPFGGHLPADGARTS